MCSFSRCEGSEITFMSFVSGVSSPYQIVRERGFRKFSSAASSMRSVSTIESNSESTVRTGLR